MKEHGHSQSEVEARIGAPPGRGCLRDVVYGGIDGSVTTFAIAAGVAGAGLSPVIIVALGLAHVLADGFSMAAGNYSGTKAELDHARRLRAVERRPLLEDPEGERREIREILRRKGLGGGVLEAAASAIAANEAAAIQLMLEGEYGLAGGIRTRCAPRWRRFWPFCWRVWCRCCRSFWAWPGRLPGRHR